MALAFGRCHSKLIFSISRTALSVQIDIDALSGEAIHSLKFCSYEW